MLTARVEVSPSGAEVLRNVLRRTDRRGKNGSARHLARLVALMPIHTWLD